jgi:hypothetical protein
MISTRSSRKSLKILESLPTDTAKTEYMATGHVTTGIVAHVHKKTIQYFHVAKIRGIIVSDNGRWLFDTPEEARTFGHELKAHWQQKVTKALAKE